MTLTTGYKTADLKAQAKRIEAQAQRLVQQLPEPPLQGLALTCCCPNCIEEDAFFSLIRTPPPQFTSQMIGQYFGGAGAVPIEMGEYEQREARVILTHVLAHLGHAVQKTREEERTYVRTCWFIEPEYWIANLIKTGVVETLPDKTRADIRDFLVEVVTYASAKGSFRLRDALCFMGMLTDAVPEVLEGFKTGPSRQHLRFWTTMARGMVSSHPSRHSPSGMDLYREFRFMPTAGVEAIMLALNDPATERMMERYALAARDDKWLTYLSRLMQWREGTLSSSFYSTARLD